jgi:hypothetical protein
MQARIARGVAPQRGMQHSRSHLNPADGLHLTDGKICIFEGEGMALCVSYQHLRQRTDLHGLIVEARRFDP